MTYSILDFLPHRKPMLLVDELLDVSMSASKTRITISEKASFYQAGRGVPSWIGVEYMGQSAACIAGYQLKEGLVDPHIGLLLGTRKYQAMTAWFKPQQVLEVSCEENSTVGGELANFNCKISDAATQEILASAKLSVFRRPISGNSDT